MPDERLQVGVHDSQLGLKLRANEIYVLQIEICTALTAHVSLDDTLTAVHDTYSRLKGQHIRAKSLHVNFGKRKQENEKRMQKGDHIGVCHHPRRCTAVIVVVAAPAAFSTMINGHGRQ